MWALEYLAWRRARVATFNSAVAVALGGMVLRLAAVLGVLIVVGILERDAFATAALSFLAAFTVYTGLRLFLFVDDRRDAGGGALVKKALSPVARAGIAALARWPSSRPATSVLSREGRSCTRWSAPKLGPDDSIAKASITCRTRS
jgi:hypothetical protein